MSSNLTEKRKLFSFPPSILKDFERNSRLSQDVISNWSRSLSRSASGKANYNIRTESDVQGQSVHKVTHQKSFSSGRKYTSKYRGVHQTFPTRRWEAQFRKDGKPTSLGCFDDEDEAARAYDRMMLWNEIHTHSLHYIKKVTDQKIFYTSLNFDIREYEHDLETLSHISQEELLHELRKQGRVQAANDTTRLT
jgi:hypothetical protein